MKKVILIALLFIALKAHSQGGTYTLANKPVNIGWADNSGTVNILGRLYVRVMDNGVATDSVLTVLNGAVRKIAINDLVTLSSITGILSSTKGGSGVNNAGTLTWGAGGTLGSAAYLDASTGHTSAGTVALRDESGKTGLEDLYLGSGYNDWLSTILTGKASTASLDNYLLKTGGTLSGSVTIDKSLDGEVSHNIINSNSGGGAYSFSQLTNGTSSFQMFHFGTNFTTSGNFIQNGSLLNANGVGGLTIATPNGTTKIVSSTVLTSFPSITAATAGRVLFSTTAGQLTDDADLTFDGTNLTVADATASGHAVNKGQLDAAVVSSRPYDVYTVEISQIGTSAPTVNFTLENTIGSIVWTRNGVGDYTATLTGAFVVGKTWAVITNGYQSNSSYQKIEIEKQDANTLNIYTYNGNTNTDGILLNANLEIRVYN